MGQQPTIGQDPSGRNVVLRAAIEINGRKLQSAMTAPLHHWAEYGPEYQEHMKAEVLRQLAEGIVKELAPEVAVTMPPPTLHEALAEALRPFDYPQAY